MPRVKITQRKEKLAISVITAIKRIRERKKRPDRKTICELVSSENGLSKATSEQLIDQLMDNGTLYEKSVRGVDSLFVDSIKSKKLEAELNDDSDCQITFTKPPPIASRDRETSSIMLDVQPTICQKEKSPLEAPNDNHFIKELNELECADLPVSTPNAQPHMENHGLDPPPLLPSMDGLAALAEALVELNRQLSLERAKTAQLREENLELKAKLLDVEKSTAIVNSFIVSPAQENSNKINAIEITTKEKLESQRRQCIVERREKYERHCIASKLVNSEGGAYKMNGKGGQFDGGNAAEKADEKRISSEKLDDSKEEFQLNTPGKVSDVHCWKENTILIAGDSMLSGLDERRLSSKGGVKVRAFPGSTIADLREHYIQPLLKKRPSSVIIHAGTNDASQEGANADKILDALLDLKTEIEKNIQGCKVILSLPTQRVDKPSANKIIQSLNKKILSLNISTINNNNISKNELGRKGLHLNMKGVNKLGGNIAAKLKCI